MDTTFVSHALIVNYHRTIAAWNKAIKGFHRADFSEFQNQLRDGVALPALILEAADNELQPNENQVATFNQRSISFMVLDYAAWDDYQGKEDVLDKTERIALQVCALLNRDRKDRNHWLYGKFEGSMNMSKVGPIFDSLYGWNVVYTVKNKQPMCMVAEDWDFSADSE